MIRTITVFDRPKAETSYEKSFSPAAPVECAFTILENGWSKFQWGARFLAFSPPETQQIFDALLASGYEADCDG